MNVLQHIAIGLAASAALFAVASDALADDAERAAICKTAEETGYTADIRNCLRLKYEAADKRLNAAYKAKMANLDEPGRAKLRNDERRWLKARDAACAESRQPDAGGTLGLVEVDSCFVDETELRVKVIDAFR
ncbi:lysozyme inhibitor LprI family protein [Burkholderia sp. AU30198]|uniref:lysozyme inhibitor LprI family protein n=1 Tax=Burkholderia sp. AU30198 TaxID=2879627 RepID=UPI001CF48F2B|nr:lysozyme inhibitor LprI family protein [Burkholderia sp. AU30198]MCA8292184.1 lysozyme inhibitor LprI family protein [Burkholderia sp. AU30198]